MKKLKWLMSMLVSTSVVASIPCVATSCSSKEDKYASYEMFTYIFDKQNPTTNFQPTKRLSFTETTYDQITTLFVKEINKDKSILADEIVYNVINNMDYVSDLSEAEGSITISIGECNEETASCSFFYEIDMKVGEKIERFRVEFKNMVFGLLYDVEDGITTYHFMSLPSYLMNTNMGSTGASSVASYLIKDPNWSHILSFYDNTFSHTNPDNYIYTALITGQDSWRAIYTFYIQQEIYQYGSIFNDIRYLEKLVVKGE